MSNQEQVPEVDSALDSYRAAVAALGVPRPCATVLLAALLERDKVAEFLETEPRTGSRVQEVSSLDRRLLDAASLVRYADWSAWRRAANAPLESWWWRLDEISEQDTERRGYGWRLLSGLLLAATLGLGADISLKLWGSGAGGLSVVSATLTVLLTSGPVTARGRELVGWLLGRLRLRPRRTGVTTVAAACLVFVLALLLRLVALPAWARVYNDRAVGLLQSGDLAAAQQALNRATNINPRYAEAYYNLANAYLDIGDYDQALALFRKALSADLALDLAYNGIGHTLILQGRCEQAIPILYSGLAVAKDDEARVALWTNLGRAYLKLSRLLEAESALSRALALNPGEAAAHCLLAQVTDETGLPASQVRLHWESCLSYADPKSPRGLELAEMARAYLAQEEEK